MKIKYTDENTLCHWEVKDQKSGNRYRMDTGNKGQFGYAPMSRERGDGIEEITPINKYQYNVTFKRPNATRTGYDTIYSGTQYTPAGEKKIASEQWINDNYKNITLATATVTGLSKGVSKMAGEAIRNPKPNKRLDLSSYSNQELQARIDRERVERTYNELFNPPKENNGMKYVKTAADVATTLGGVALSVFQVINGVKSLKTSK